MNTTKKETLNINLPHAAQKEQDAVFTLHYLRHFKNVTGKILDVGCLTGNFLALDKNNILGVDIDEGAVEIAKKRGFNAHKMDVCDCLQFEDNTFAAINCTAVLEHIKDPQKAMTEMFRVLKPGGKLVAMTPDIMKWKFNFWKCAYHLYGHPFSEKSLYALAYDTGFKKVNVTHDYSSFFVKKMNKLGFNIRYIQKFQRTLYHFKKSKNLLLIAIK